MARYSIALRHKDGLVAHSTTFPHVIKASFRTTLAVVGVVTLVYSSATGGYDVVRTHVHGVVKREENATVQRCFRVTVQNLRPAKHRYQDRHAVNENVSAV